MTVDPKDPRAYGIYTGVPEDERLSLANLKRVEELTSVFEQKPKKKGGHSRPKAKSRRNPRKKQKRRYRRA